jgi:SAM-dependent methyltransferase
MGDKNQIYYLTKHIPSLNGSILEVGSKDYGSTSSYRKLYANCEYVGVDMEMGEGVDIVLDMVLGTGSLPLSHFDLVICCSVLEHVSKPWIFAENLQQLIKPNGMVYMSVPWVWRYHPYPDDYFRFSWRGIQELFPKLVWSNIEYSTNIEGEFVDISTNGLNIDNGMAIHKRVSFLSKYKRKYLPYLMINMLGKKLE